MNLIYLPFIFIFFVFAGCTNTNAPGNTAINKISQQERDAMEDVEAGSLIYNTTTKQIEYYDGARWNALVARPDEAIKQPLWAIDCGNIPVNEKPAEFNITTPAGLDSFAFKKMMPFLSQYSQNWPSGFDTVAALVLAVYSAVKHGTGNTNLAVENMHDPTIWPAERWVRFFSKDSGSVWCGGNSHFLSRVMERYYPVGEISVGLPSENAMHVPGLHQFNVVYLHGKYYPVDAMFGTLYLSSEKGKLIPLPLKQLYIDLKQSRGENIHFASFGLPGQYLISDSCDCFQDIISPNFEAELTNFVLHSENASAKYICIAPRTAEDYVDYYLNDFNEVANSYNDPFGIQTWHDLKKLPLYRRYISASPANYKYFKNLDSELDSIFNMVPWGL